MLKLKRLEKRDTDSLKNKVLKRLRIKFITMTMVMIAIVLAIVFSVICFVTYHQDVYGVFSALNNSVSSASIYASTSNDGYSNSSNDGNNYSNQDYSGRIPEIGSLQGNRGRIIPIAVYKLESNSTFGFITSMSAATVSDDTLSAHVSEIFALEDGTGSLKSCGLYYAKNTVGDASYIAFADSSAATSWKTHALILSIIGFFALIIFFIISLFFSRWALGPVQRAWTKQRQFISDASHDLKTPITVIQANTEILMSNPDESIRSQEQWLESTQVETMHMQQLVKDLLYLARMDEQPAPPLKEPVDISQIAETEALEFESIAFEQDVELSADIAPDITILGDEAKIHRLFTILLDNACKYAPEKNKIEITLQRATSAVQLIVHNTGSYIEPKDLEHIFDRFYRSDSSRSDSQNSHGLGLAIAKAIVTEQGGSIRATSSEEDGTRFIITFA